MLRGAVGKVMWVGRATVFLIGLAVILALVFGLASTALGANGDPWRLGRSNAATAITSLAGATGVNGPMVRITNNNAGANDTALELRVQDGEAPMGVNSDTKVTDLNADLLDGKHASDLGVNGLQKVTSTSAVNSNSDKSAAATCPADKVVVGTGYDIAGAKSGDSPNRLTDVVVDTVNPINSTAVNVVAFEEDATTANWSVTAFAICATAP